MKRIRGDHGELDLEIPVGEQGAYTVEPFTFTGTWEMAMRELRHRRFVGRFLGAGDDGSWIVRIYGPVEDLSQIVCKLAVA